MLRPPRDPKQPLLSKALVMRTLFVSLLMQLGGYGLLIWEQRFGGATLEEARTIVTNLIIVTESYYLLNCRSLTQPFIRLGWCSNPWIWRGIVGMLVVQLMFNYVPLMNRLFQSAPVRAESWLHVALVGAIVFFLIEIEKWIRFGRGGRSGNPPE
jgi:Ca2+-transporting ATPase